jgi:hypothetical protein
VAFAARVGRRLAAAKGGDLVGDEAALPEIDCAVDDSGARRTATLRFFDETRVSGG